MKLTLLVSLAFVGCNASYYYNLDKIFKNNPDAPPTGATVIPGPTGKNGQAKAVILNQDKPNYVTGRESAFMISSLTNSEDFTYYTWLKTPASSLEKNKEWMFFTLQSKKKPRPILFGIGLSFLSKRGQGSEDVKGKEEYAQYLTLKQYTSYDLNTKTQTFPVKENFKPNTWYELMMRIIVKESGTNTRRRRAVSDVSVNVRVNCKSIGTFKLPDGRFDNYLPTGYAVFGSSLKTGTSEVLETEHAFPGALAKSQLINGKYAFEFYSPCDADFSFKALPAEPLPSDYNDANWKLFQKVTSGVKTVSITCPGLTPTRYNGEIWIEDECNQHECKNGKVTTSWICSDRLCTDENTGKQYKMHESWIDSKDVCKRLTCVKEFDDITSVNIKCNPITKDDCPDGFDRIKLPTECCAKCPSETCPQGKKYYEGCKRTCADGGRYVCPKKELKCWCPQGYAEDDDGKCIPLNSCPCVSGSIIYKPGQTALRSSCETCVCVNGDMQCFVRC